MKNGTITISAEEIKNGFNIIVDGKPYAIEYPEDIWGPLPQSLKDLLIENLTFANTHFLPMLLKKDHLNYATKRPLFDSQLFKNQLYDLIYCEHIDEEPQLSYLRRFYNLEPEFALGESTFVPQKNIPQFKSNQATAVIPFSFGKESSLTAALCLELGIKPILVYVSEPSQPYEEELKLKNLKKLEEEFGVKTYFLKHEPGLFRYGAAFGFTKATELGWGTEATIFTLLMMPFVYAHQAQYILFGNEYVNKETYMWNKWKVFSSYDQHPDWVPHQNNIARLLTNGQCRVCTTLEPLEETTIFYILQHRYPEIGKYEFSCHARKPLYPDSQWCHRCNKCWFYYLWVRGLSLDPDKLGFKEDIINNKEMYSYFVSLHKNFDPELDFCVKLLTKRKIPVEFADKVIKYGKGKAKSWKWYCNHVTTFRPAYNLPQDYEKRIYQIFEEEMKSLKGILPN